MAIHTTDAIILRRYLFRETSVIVSCLTRDFGKIKGLVKGLRSSPNRYRSALEPMTINRVVFYDSRNSSLHLISQCELMAPLSTLQQDWDRAQSAAFCVDLADTVIPLEDPMPNVYALLQDCLEHLALGRDERLMRLYFTVRLLRLIGFDPQVDQCTGCASWVQRDGYWSARQGGLLCPRCLHEDPQAEAAIPEMVEAIRELADGPPSPNVSASILSLLQERLREFLLWRLDRPLRTMRLSMGKAQ